MVHKYRYRYNEGHVQAGDHPKKLKLNNLNKFKRDGFGYDPVRSKIAQIFV